MTLDEFLQELSARQGLHRKIGLVTRYWRQVQRLPADKQQQVALALGSKAAWNRLEKLFAKDGLSEGELAVKRALDRVGAADPDELRHLASEVRAGNYADVSRELVEVVGRALDEEADADETAGVSKDAVIDHAEPTDDVPPVVAAAAVVASSSPLPEVVAESERPASEAVATPERPAPEALAEPGPPAPETVAESAPPTPEAVSRPASPSPDVVPTSSPPTLEVAAEPDTGPILSATEKLGVLRTLSADPGYGVRLGRSGRAQLLARLGPGWATRRALSELIRGQAVDDLDEALQLAGNLHSDVQNAWCLADLVQHWVLDETELERVVAAARNPAAASRLRRRHARRGTSLRA